jgi:hypothetical protein
MYFRTHILYSGYCWPTNVQQLFIIIIIILIIIAIIIIIVIIRNINTVTNLFSCNKYLTISICLTILYLMLILWLIWLLDSYSTSLRSVLLLKSCFPASTMQ